MRLIPSLAGLLLMTSVAAAQPTPSPDEPGQMAPMQAQPQPQSHPRFADRFNAANTTHDGRLTREQAQAGRMGNIAKNFDVIDVDHKGYLTEQDIKAWHRAKRQANAAQPASQPGFAPQ